MNHRDVRASLAAVIADIDTGRIRVPPLGIVGRRVGGSVIAAALGLGAGACDTTKPAKSTPTTTVLSEEKPAHSAPDPDALTSEPLPPYGAVLPTEPTADAGPPDAAPRSEPTAEPGPRPRDATSAKHKDPRPRPIDPPFGPEYFAPDG